MNEVVFDPNG